MRNGMLSLIFLSNVPIYKGNVGSGLYNRIYMLTAPLKRNTNFVEKF